MKLKQYLEQLNKLAKENPESLEMEVFTSRDDEGNGYNAVYYSPAVHRTENLCDVHTDDEEVVVLN